MEDLNKQISNLNFKINDIELKIMSLEIEVSRSLDQYEKELDPLIKDRCFVIYQLTNEQLQSKKDQLKQLRDVKLLLLSQSEGNYSTLG